MITIAVEVLTEAQAEDVRRAAHQIVFGKYATPLPAEPRMVPLGPEDVPPGSAATPTDQRGKYYRMIRGTASHGFDYGDESFVTWEQARECLLIHRPGDLDADGKPAWRKCEKEAQP